MRSTKKCVPPDRDGASSPARAASSRSAASFAATRIAWIAGIVLVYSIMFATGAAIFHNTKQFTIFGSALVISAVSLIVIMRREKAETVDPQITQMERR